MEDRQASEPQTVKVRDTRRRRPSAMGPCHVWSELQGPGDSMAYIQFNI